MKTKETVTIFRKHIDKEPLQVRVMARAEGYAMVRREGRAPFVVSEKEISHTEVGKESTPAERKSL